MCVSIHPPVLVCPAEDLTQCPTHTKPKQQHTGSIAILDLPNAQCKPPLKKNRLKSRSFPEGGEACVFLDDANQCSIYEAR